MGEAFLAGQKGCGTKFKTGSYTHESSIATTLTVDVGFTPDVVIVYQDYNNHQNVATSSTSTARYNNVPKILTAEYKTSTDGIIENGFNTYVYGEYTLYYIAIKF